MAYVLGRHELDTTLYELRRAGQRVPLEPQAFDVLAYLVQHRERVGGWHCCGIWRWASIEWSICKGILGWRSPRSART